MKIYGTNLVHSAQVVGGPHRAASTSAAAYSSSLAEVDQLDISPAAQRASQSLEGSIRHDRVAELRAAIASGGYETEDKLNVALDRLLDAIG